jgi:hypothetical protein
MAGETVSPEIMGVSLAASPGVLPLGTGTVDVTKYYKER